jgi:hypothetical protein
MFFDMVYHWLTLSGSMALVLSVGVLHIVSETSNADITMIIAHKPNLAGLDSLLYQFFIVYFFNVLF